MAGLRALFLFFLIQLIPNTLANVEKVIFLGPSSLQIPQQQPTLDDLQLFVLSPNQATLRTELRAEFPSNSSSRGFASWILIDGMTEGQRYEVRVCWAATQPTSFWLSTYELPQVFGSPELITSLAEYSTAREARVEALDDHIPGVSSTFRKSASYGTEKLESVLFLQIFAMADYYTWNKTLMEDVPPVLVDIILDPFILNVLPRSLLPTLGYLVILAVGGWFIAKLIAGWLQIVARTDEQKKKA